MTGIDITGKLSALIRTQAGTLQAPQKPIDNKPDTKQAQSTRSSATDWMTQVALRVSTINADDPQRRRKAFRIYLASVLSRELGINQVHGAEFQHLLDKVQDTMSADTELNKAIDQAGELLLRQAAVKNENS